MKRIVKKIILLIGVFLFISACAKANYYSAQTLKRGERVLSPAIDNLFLYKTATKKYTFGMTPSFGYVHGLPYRFEAGLRLYLPYVLEGMVRRQLNPRDFELFEVSANMHFGIRYLFNEDEAEVVDKYLKPGLTVSKEINRYQPYLGYCRLIPEYQGTLNFSKNSTHSSRNVFFL